MADDTNIQDLTRKFWNDFSQTLMSKYNSQTGGSNDPTSFLPATQGVIANFTPLDGSTLSDDKQMSTFNLALHDFADRMPPWSVAWSGDSDGSLFGAYSDFVEQLHTVPVLSGTDLATAQTDLTAEEAKLSAYVDDVGKIESGFKASYRDDNMADPDMMTWSPGYSISTMNSDWKTYQTTADYKKRLEDIQQAQGADLAGVSEKIDTLQNQIYGAGFTELSEAISDARNADPDFPNDMDDDDKAEFQMKSGDDGWLPKYDVQGGDKSSILSNYKTWLAAAQGALASAAGGGGAPSNPKYSFSLQSSSSSEQKTETKFSANATFPVEDIFMVDVGGSGDYKSTSIEKDDLSMNVTYQDMFLLQVQPGRRWFKPDIVKAYGSSQYYTANSPYMSKPLNGPEGLLNLQITGVMIAVGKTITYTSQQFKEHDWSENFSASVGVSILGFIHLGGGNTSENYSSTTMTTTAQGFTIADTSGNPSIIGIVVQEIAPPATA